MTEMIKIEDLRPAEGSTKKSKRVGRGRASGCGKTSCRGNNGEGQRSGRSAKRGFEGGQMPGYRQMPKLKGFEVINRVEYAAINVSDLEKFGMEKVCLNCLKEAGKVRNNAKALRVLGDGEITKAVTVKAAHFSATAKEKIEKAGGKVELA